MNKYLFIHIPKTGGSCLKKNLSIDERFIDTKHKIISRLHTEFKLDEYFKFAFVRNPWDRFVSAYFYLKQIQSNPNHKWMHDYPRSKEINTLYPDFDDFVRSDLWRTNPRAWFHFKPQLGFIFNNRKNDVDFIGRFENLQEDFDKVCSHIDLPTQKLIPINTSRHKHYTEYYDDDTKKIVGYYYKKDIKYFNYTFGE